MVDHVIKVIPCLGHEVGDVGLKLGITQLVVAYIIMLLDGARRLAEGTGDVLHTGHMGMAGGADGSVMHLPLFVSTTTGT